MVNTLQYKNSIDTDEGEWTGSPQTVHFQAAEAGILLRKLEIGV